MSPAFRLLGPLLTLLCVGAAYALLERARKSAPPSPPAAAQPTPAPSWSPLERDVLMNLEALSRAEAPPLKALAAALDAEPGLRKALASGLDPASAASFKALVAAHAEQPGFASALDALTKGGAPPPADCGETAKPEAPKPLLGPPPEPGCSGPESPLSPPP